MLSSVRLSQGSRAEFSARIVDNFSGNRYNNPNIETSCDENSKRTRMRREGPDGARPSERTPNPFLSCAAQAVLREAVPGAPVKALRYLISIMYPQRLPL